MESSDAQLVRGVFTDFVGCNTLLGKSSLYNVYIKIIPKHLIKNIFK